MKCSKCNYLNNSTDSYCASCGERLVKEKVGEQQLNNSQNMQSYSGTQYGGNSQYSGNPYGSSYNSYQQSTTGNGKATTSLIFGIISLLCGITLIIISGATTPSTALVLFAVIAVAVIPFGICAIVFGVQSKIELQAAGEPTGKAIAGIVLGSISLFSVIVATIIANVIF